MPTIMSAIMIFNSACNNVYNNVAIREINLNKKLQVSSQYDEIMMTTCKNK